MIMAKELIQPLEVAKRIDNGLGAAAEFSRFKTAAIEVVRALAALTCGRRDRAAEHFRPANSHAGARSEFARFLFW